MSIASTILSALFALALLGSASGKFRKLPMQRELMLSVGLKENALPVLGSLEVLAALGLGLGIVWWPAAIAAAIGAILYFIGAAIAHLRVGDKKFRVRSSC